ncbi:alpha/beta hydrolase [Bacillus sp. CGMCC 1.16607]|uniref:alpha/beta hydrolase n=1 Tax=Bacillus sp. CGMCC 1.16607 TaxID=3351842 RepID=UPI00362EDF45
MNRGLTKDIQLYSKELQEEVQMLIYLPSSFSPLYKYQLLIAQDGRDYFQLGRIGRMTDELLHNKEMANTIIIGLPYRDVEDRRQKYHPDGGKHKAYIRFLAHELVPFLDREFPSFQMGMGRTLLGDSLAATVSLLAALDYPHTFGKLILQSPYVNEEVLTRVQQFDQTHLLDVYHVVGTEETDVPTRNEKERNFLEANRKLSTIFKEKNFPYFYDEFNGDHTWTYWQPDLKRALSHLLR